ncbi:FecR family protein [Luteimonas sp. A277]
MDVADRQDIHAAAAGWVVREDRGPLTSFERAERERWLAASPRHFGAYARARAVLAWSDRMAVAVPPARASRAPRGRRWSLAAAAVLLVALAGALLLVSPRGMLHQTARGEILRVALEDGSTMTLDADSQVRVHFGRDGRRLQLLSGMALFDVVHDPQRPFTVTADRTRVVAVGTRFTVSMDKSRGGGPGPVEVLVSEGVVDVAAAGSHPAPARLHAGMRALARPEVGVEVEQVDEQDLGRRLLWREGMLAFNGDTLSVAAARFRRYSDLAIIIDDPSVGSRRVVGLYPANDPAGFARNVALSLGLEVEQRADGVRLSAPALRDGVSPSMPRMQ